MSDEHATPEVTDLGEIPATHSTLAVATLSLRYAEDVPTLVATGGTAVPAALQVVDGNGQVVAVYTAERAVGGAERRYDFLISSMSITDES